VGLRHRHGARVADLARIAMALAPPAGADSPAPGWLRFGAQALGDGQGLAWTEMSRGLLVHWVRLEPGWRDPAGARLADCRVLAPTEWNFHPQGALARALARAPLHDDVVKVAVTAFDPCVAFDIARPPEAPHA
jgi:Ni,Fe-hydrogenase III large subunit